MMDTILNLGLNDETVIGLAKKTNNERFAYDSYRRFIQMFSDVVMEVEKAKFEAILDAVKEENGAHVDTDLIAENLKEVVRRYKELYLKEKGQEFPRIPGTAHGSHQGRFPFLGQSPRHRLPPPERHPRRLGYCRQRAGHGVRQHGQ